MNYFDLLQTLAEVSAAFAGFTAIILAFQANSEILISQRIGVIHFLQLSLGVVILALVPIVLSSVATIEQHLWQYSNALLGTYHFYVMGWMLTRINQSAAHSLLGPVPGILAVVGVSSAGLNLTIAVGALGHLEVFAYLFGLLWLLCMALVHFVALLLHRINDPRGTRRM